MSDFVANSCGYAEVYAEVIYIYIYVSIAEFLWGPLHYMLIRNFGGQPQKKQILNLQKAYTYLYKTYEAYMIHFPLIYMQVLQTNVIFSC